MSAAPIPTPVLAAPKYDNARIADPSAWYTDNALALQRYYQVCDAAVRAAGGPTNPRDELGEYDYFRRVQYERAAAAVLLKRREL